MRRFGKPADARRTTDPNLLVEDQPGQLAGAVQLAGAAGQHHTAPGDLVEAERVDPEMGAADRGSVVAHASRGGGHDMHVDGEPLADHAARVSDAAALIDREADRDRMDDLAIVRFAHAIAALKDLAQFGVADL